MPKCYKCGTEQPVLTSKFGVIEGAKFGAALCDKCIKEAEKSEASK